jgi:hypothetical protein
MNTYNQIVNPKTGRRVNINCKIGQNVLRNYMQALNNEQIGSGDKCGYNPNTDRCDRSKKHIENEEWCEPSKNRCKFTQGAKSLGKAGRKKSPLSNPLPLPFPRFRGEDYPQDTSLAPKAKKVATIKANPFAMKKSPSWKKKLKRALFKVKIINGWSKLVKDKLYAIDEKILDKLENKLNDILDHPDEYLNKHVNEVFDPEVSSWINNMNNNLIEGVTEMALNYNDSVLLIYEVVNGVHNKVINQSALDTIRTIFTINTLGNIQNKIDLGKEFSNSVISLLDTPKEMSEARAKELSKIKVGLHKTLGAATVQKGGYYNFNQTGGGRMMSFLTASKKKAVNLYQSANQCMTHNFKNTKFEKASELIQNKTKELKNKGFLLQETIEDHLANFDWDSALEIFKSPDKDRSEMGSFMYQNRGLIKGYMDDDLVSALRFSSGISHDMGGDLDFNLFGGGKFDFIPIVMGLGAYGLVTGSEGAASAMVIVCILGIGKGLLFSNKYFDNHIDY